MEYLLLCVLFQISYGLTYSCNGLSLFIRNGNIEFFFKFHDQFNCVQRICSEIIRKRSLRCNFVLINTKFVNNNFLYPCCNV